MLREVVSVNAYISLCSVFAAEESAGIDSVAGMRAVIGGLIGNITTLLESHNMIQA
jgi:hypothetical protein